MSKKTETIEPTKDWMKIKSLEDACKNNGTTPEEVLPYKDPVTWEQNALNAVATIWEMTKAINGDWKADYKNSNQTKWFPVFRMTPTGLVFSCAYCEGWNSSSYAYIGAPFAIESDEKAEYMGNEFLHIYKQYIIK